ncbi:MAG: aminoacyl-tRNA deacylase [Anaerolinea sp.]|nr:aminoacyl-tRNA deacylase [Anaerolinea sp.]
MADKINSMRLLDQHKIPYEVLEYDGSQFHDAEEVAEMLGIPPHLIYKTLVVEPDGGGKPMLALLASNRHLDLKRLAAAAGEKKVRMAAHKDAEAQTGLKVGGISPLALTQKNWKVFLDQPATGLQHITLSAGQRGLQIRMPVTALIGLVKARVAEIGTDQA